MPTNQWKEDTFGQEIFPGETYQAGIGQGYDVVTPIQLINAYTALANGGKLYEPQVVREVIGADGNVVRAFQPKLIHKLDVSSNALRIMREAARTVVTIRHTYNLVELPIKVAGKSGTAEFGTRDAQGRLPFHSWFIGLRPEGPGQRRLRRSGLAAGGPGVRQQLANRRQRRDRDREVLPAAALRDREGLPFARVAPARQLLRRLRVEIIESRILIGRRGLMGTLRVERSRVRDWASRPVGAAWRAFDLQLTIYALLLAGIGLAMAYSNSDDTVLQGGSTFLRGLMWAGIAIVVFTAAAVFDYKWLKTFAWPIYFVNLGLLVVSLLIGDGVSGAARWVSILGFQFQFSELAKILMIVVLANYLARREASLDSIWSILGAAVIVGPPAVLVLLQPDLGTSLVFGAILAGMLFMSGASLKWLTVLAGAFLAAVPIIWTNVLRDYQKQRLISFVDPSADPQGSGFQLAQSQSAVTSGGLFGQGLTNGAPAQLDFLPVQSTDFVFAILAHELGFIGAMVVFALFAALVWRILVSGWRSRDPFGMLLASGLASMILFQIVVNIGMVLGIMPITGIPLPFVTHGGASLVSLALGLGVLESINVRQTRAEW